MKISGYLKKFMEYGDLWFFCAFLLTFTLSIRKVLFFYPIHGEFNEYTAAYLYLSDIFLIGMLTFWLLNLYYNKTVTLSSIKLWITNLFLNLSTGLPLLLVIFSFISYFWSDNKAISLFRSIKLLELYFFYIYIYFRIVARGPILKSLLGIIIFSGAIQSIIGIWQFMIQYSIGLRFLRESIISPSISGVAKVIFNDHAVIRAYGLMPHPNILGGFLLFSIIITLLYKKLFHVEQFNIQNTIDRSIKKAKTERRIEKCSTWNIYIINTVMTMQLLALFLTFSKSAILGLVIGLIYIFVPRGTFSRESSGYLKINKLFSFSFGRTISVQFRKLILGFAIIIMSFVIFSKPNLNALFIKSLNERSFYLNVSRGTILENPFLGLGMGQFIESISNYKNGIAQIWQYQPVHNVYLLIWSELGVVSLVIFIFWIWILSRCNSKIQKCSTWNINMLTKFEQVKSVQTEGIVDPSFSANEKSGTGDITILYNDNGKLSILTIRHYSKGILMGFLFIMLFDHYLWDIWPGQIMFFLVLGIIAGLNKRMLKLN